jgi:hypothetical protein
VKINTLSKRLALQEVFDALAVEPGGALPYFDLLRSWEDTGMRRRDLDDALADAIGQGDLIETYCHEGRIMVLTDLGHERAQVNPSTLRQIENLRSAMTALEWARQRPRRGVRSGRRADDSPPLH